MARDRCLVCRLGGHGVAVHPLTRDEKTVQGKRMRARCLPMLRQAIEAFSAESPGTDAIRRLRTAHISVVFVVSKLP
jgi:hypothetical protein